MSIKQYHIDECESTNILLKAMSNEAELPDGFIVSADFQTGGRGQAGNSWESERAKNLLFSMLIYPHHIAIQEQFLISQITSLSIKKVLDNYTDVIKIKWPNDIYWRDQKIGGILIENSLFRNRIDKSILGIGLNINQEKFISDAPNPISLKQIIAKESDLALILENIRDAILEMYHRKISDEISKEYFNHLYRNDGYYHYFDVERDEHFIGKIIEVEKDGKLIIQDNEGGNRSFYFKEVEFMK